jgi:hypothetical protein
MTRGPYRRLLGIAVAFESYRILPRNLILRRLFNESKPSIQDRFSRYARHGRSTKTAAARHSTFATFSGDDNAARSGYGVNSKRRIERQPDPDREASEGPIIKSGGTSP